MKNTLFGLVLLTATIGLISCNSDSDPNLSANAIIGTWTIETAEGTEWEQGTGIITPRADDPELLNGKLIITSSFIQVYADASLIGEFAYSLDVENSEITLVGVGTFSIQFKNHFMNWSQLEPTANDYEYNEGGDNYLFFQKFWGLRENK